MVTGQLRRSTPWHWNCPRMPESSPETAPGTRTIARASGGLSGRPGLEALNRTADAWNAEGKGAEARSVCDAPTSSPAASSRSESGWARVTLEGRWDV